MRLPDSVAFPAGIQRVVIARLDQYSARLPVPARAA